MKLKFIKDSNTFKKDEVAEVDELYAKAFVAMGFAEPYTEEEPKPKAKTTTKKTTAK